jgi:hypothetical protein
MGALCHSLTNFDGRGKKLRILVHPDTSVHRRISAPHPSNYATDAEGRKISNAKNQSDAGLPMPEVHVPPKPALRVADCVLDGMLSAG